MKCVLKRACLLLMAFVLCMTTAAAQAATVSKNGFRVTLETDKPSYQAGEKIDVTLSIENLSDQLIKPLNVEYQLPAMCTLVQRSMQPELPAIQQQNTLTMSTELAVISSPDTLLPQTGDHSGLMLWLALGTASVFVLYCVSVRKRREMVAVFLSAAILSGTAAPAGTAAAEADALDRVRAKMQAGDVLHALPETAEKIIVSQAVTIMGVQTKISAAVTLSGVAESNAVITPYEQLLNKPLEETITDSTEIKYDMSLDDADFILPQSQHNYPSNSDYLYYIRGGEGVEALSVQFGSACEMEYSFDALLIYDQDGQYVSCYTGVEIADKIVTVNTGGMIIRLVSDTSVNKYGFAVDEIISHTNPQITACFINGSGAAAVKWNQVYGYTGCLIERADVNEEGVIGAYSAIASVSGSTYVYVDASVEMGQCYAYRIRQSYEIDALNYMTGYSEPKLIYAIGRPTLTSGTTATVDGLPAITLKWSAAASAQEYRIYRSSTEDGTFEQVGTSKTTSFTDVLEKKNAYYYKVCGYADYAGATYNGLNSEIACYGYVLPPSTVNIRSASTSRIILSWSEVPIADGYAVFRSTSRTGTYTCIAKTSATNGTFDPARSTGMSFYKIRAYTITNGKYTYSADSKIVGIYALDTPTGLTAVENSDSSIRITWDPVDNAQSYKIYYSSAQNGTYTECGTTSVKGKTLTTVPTTLSPVYLKVRAMRTDGSVTSASNLSSAVKVTRAVNPINVRNLYIFEENIPGASSIRTYDGDMELLNSMFSKASPFGRPVTTISYRDLTKTQVLAKINSIANLADSNDVTTFFMSCHGANGITTGSQAGMMALSDGNWMTFEELAAALKKIPGRVVIILTSCGSGSSINGALSNGDGEVTFDEEMFMDEFIDVIAKYDEQIYVADQEEAAMTEQPATGELRVSNKFYVITAARGGENGYYYQDGYTILLEWMNNGVMGADADGNGTVTLGEMEDYLTELGNTTQISTLDGYEYMHPQVYPENSSFALFVER